MQFDQFARIIEDLKETGKVVDKSSKYLKASVFEKHNILIADLLESIYTADAITYVLFEWLRGNKSSLSQTLPDGTVIEHDLQTVHDLWKVMEMYKVDDVSVNKVDKKD